MTWGMQNCQFKWVPPDTVTPLLRLVSVACTVRARHSVEGSFVAKALMGAHFCPPLEARL
jgi:hypothetical protein